VSGNTNPTWPALPLAQWQSTYETLHMWLQIVGKTRLAFAPMQNHWWQIALYVTPRGLTTSAIPFGDRSFTVDVDFIAHQLTVQTSVGTKRVLPLGPQPVCDFYRDYMAALASVGVQPKVMARPVEITTAIPFAQDRTHAAYDPDAAHRCWRILVHADRVFKRFAGRFIGKASPVHFFWGSFDLAYTRFSGRVAPRHPGGAPNCPDYVMVEAYSHECSSCGFWPGGGAVAEPGFYAYAYPEPDGYAQRALAPAGASYNQDLREFVLPYEVVRRADDPDATLLRFLQSTYEAAAELGGWDRNALERTAPITSGQRA